MNMRFEYTILKINEWDGSVVVQYDKSGCTSVIRQIGIPPEITEGEVEDYLTNQIALNVPWDVWATNTNSITRALSGKIGKRKSVIFTGEEPELDTVPAPPGPTIITKEVMTTEDI
jgi:hypothetical protein